MKRKQRSDAESFGLILNSEWYAPSEMISPPRHGQQTLRGIRWKRAYGGQIVHKGKAFPGEHAAIVDEDLWRRVQSHLEENRMNGGRVKKSSSQACWLVSSSTPVPNP
jgi:Recombinase